jgi:hypothetical protein
MKAGKSLIELANAITYQRNHSKDYIVPISRLNAEVTNSNSLALTFTNGVKHSMPLNSWSSSQVASYTDIPKQYFDRIQMESPELAASNINHGLSKRSENTQEARLIRTIDGNVRGFLSSRYRILDSYDMLEAVLPTAQKHSLDIISSEITDRRLFIKFLSPTLMGEVQKNDVVQYGLTISTSDVGAGSIRVEPLIYRLVCLNGLISNTAVRKYHVGKNNEENEAFEIFSDRTKELTDAAFWNQVKDIVEASLKPENFTREIDRLKQAVSLSITNFDLPEVIELSMKAVGITGEDNKNSLLAALASGNEGAGLTQWGLINAYTRVAQADRLGYEESIQFERAAGKILELPKRDWARIAESVA